jgi:hypothetical protein
MHENAPTIYGIDGLICVQVNKEEFRSRPIRAFVDVFAQSQSECVITTSGKNINFNRKSRVLNKAFLEGGGFLIFWIEFNMTRYKTDIEFSKHLSIGFTFYCLVLKLSAFEQRRTQGDIRKLTINF